MSLLYGNLKIVKHSKMVALTLSNQPIKMKEIKVLHDMKDLVLHHRIDHSKKLCHIEVFKKTWYLPIMIKLPRFIFKPIAKTGIRTYSSSGEMMDKIISRTFNNFDEMHTDNTGFDVETDIQRFHSVAVFVYMWVNKQYRKRNLGDFLLINAMKLCKDRGDEYMLLVHDDDGSGKLIKYYEDRGFYPISDFIENGMICKL
jgi:GNAT superfamily N-acetyltransferase